MSREGGALKLDSLSQLAAMYVKRSGIPKPGARHLFRHTMATLMLEGGADIRYVQQILGHAELSTTQIYTQVSIRRLDHVHSLTHPAALLRSRRERPAGEGDENSLTHEELFDSLAAEEEEQLSAGGSVSA